MGAGFAELILSLSDLLKGVEAPGLVALLIFVAAGSAAAAAQWTLGRACALPRDLTLVLQSSGEPLTLDDIERLSLPRPGRRYPGAAARQARAWRAYCREITVSGGVARAPSSPADALTRTALGLRLSGWRIVPGTLVGVGLALTFLGLIAALREAGFAIAASGDSPEAVREALSGLLSIASAKFIMSLAGLVSSILFGIFLKAWEARLDAVAEGLQSAVAARVRVETPEAALRDLLASSLRIEAAIARAGER